MSPDNEQLVLEFCAAWSNRDVDELLGYLAPDATYHNMPMDPVRGHAAIRRVFDLFLSPADEVDWRVRNIASTGDLVFAERVDRFTISDRIVELPIVGVFEIADGRIAHWRDYFDFATWQRQVS